MSERAVNRRSFVTGTGLVVSGVLSGCSSASAAGADALVVPSPDGSVELRFRVTPDGPQYSVVRDEHVVLDWSGMGFELGGGERLREGLAVGGVHQDELDETWRPVWGARSEVRSRCRRALVRLRAPERERARISALDLEFRVFDDGVGFRYGFAPGREQDPFEVLEELTEFRFAGDHTAWSIPANYDSYEYLHAETPLTGVGQVAEWQDPREEEGEQLGCAATPLTVRVADDCYAALHEAALYDFAEMTLAKIGGGPSLRSALVPRKGEGGVKARLRGPVATPWRTVVVGERPGDLVESHLVLNLNDPCAIEDTSWIRPANYVGVWWEIHKGLSTWHPGPDVGASTENTIRYIDFAAENGISHVLAEGWNFGWEAGESDDFGKQQNFLEPNPRFDLERVVEHGRRRGVGFLAHNETGGGVENYERQIDDAFALYERLGLPGVKTGYAGTIDQHYHHDQWMVGHYQRVVEKAAEHRLMLDAHEPIKGTGIERTYPNFVSREGVRGQEAEAWSRGNPPEHTVTLPFTRMLAGPVDYTPGIFNTTWFPPQSPEDSFGQRNDGTRVHTTRAHQIALYPVLLSGVQMLADVPEHYRDLPEFEFLRQVPATWDDTRVINGAIGDHITVARRSGRRWFVGSLTDEHPRSLPVPLEFLGPGEYVAHLCTDAPETDLDSAPDAVATSSWLVDAATTVRAEMTGGSGHSVRIEPATADDLASLPRYR